MGTSLNITLMVPCSMTLAAPWLGTMVRPSARTVPFAVSNGRAAAPSPSLLHAPSSSTPRTAHERQGPVADAIVRSLTRSTLPAHPPVLGQELSVHCPALASKRPGQPPSARARH